jgi:cold shock CspA family protein/ribosome-associated translation inhibitor RaiA
MQVPLHISFEHIGHSDPIEARVREEAKKLEQFHGRITAARVVIGRPQHRHHKGDTYRVRIHLTVPGAADIVINRDPDVTGAHEDAYVTIRDAFKAARRQLQDLVREQQGQVKMHAPPPHGVIASLYPDRDHGFITSADGREIYFHRNSVEGGAFEKLRVGEEVRFSEEVGVKGPQATYVRALGKHHLE